MRKTLSVIAISTALLATGAPIASAADKPAPAPVPAECQPYQAAADELELVSAQRLVQISALDQQVTTLRATVAHQNAEIARLRHRLHRHG